jgi:hypothetical protein
MADLSFSVDAGMQDGTGDGSYMDFIHNFLSVAAVSAHQLNYKQFEYSRIELMRLIDYNGTP